MQQEIHNCHHYDVHHIQNAKCRKCGKLGHIARVCRSSIALVVYNQSPELAVVTVTKTQEKQFIFTSLSCLLPTANRQASPFNGGRSFTSYFYQSEDMAGSPAAKARANL